MNLLLLSVDVADLGARSAIDSALNRLVSPGGKLRRISRGLYDRPWTNQLTGRHARRTSRRAVAIARRHGLPYLLDGMTAANAPGFTDGVPVTCPRDRGD